MTVAMCGDQVEEGSDCRLLINKSPRLEEVLQSNCWVLFIKSLHYGR